VSDSSLLVRLGAAALLPVALSGCSAMEAALGIASPRAPDYDYGGESERTAEPIAQDRLAFLGDDLESGVASDGDTLLAWGGPGGARPGQQPAGGAPADPGADPRPDRRERAPGTAVEPGRSTPLLIYTAELHLAVLDVLPQQRKVADLARKLGGFIAYQDDTRITIRIPSRRFEEALEAVGELGDLLHRNVQALDVTEEFRDVAIRLRNAEVVRAQLERLLEKADKVEEALEVQRELAKVTETIERYKGRLRFLEDRIAYSTVTVRFQPLPRELLSREDPFRLPFPWLQEVGLGRLLDLGY